MHRWHHSLEAGMEEAGEGFGRAAQPFLAICGLFFAERRYHCGYSIGINPRERRLRAAPPAHRTTQ